MRSRMPEVNAVPSRRTVREWEALIEYQHRGWTDEGIVLRDLLFGDVDRGGRRVRAVVRKHDSAALIGKDNARELRATCFRPEGAWPLVLVEIRDQSHHEVIPVEEFCESQPGEPADMALLRERMRQELRWAREYGSEGPAEVQG